MKDSPVEKLYVLATCLLMFCTYTIPAWSAVSLSDCRPLETRAELWWECNLLPALHRETMPDTAGLSRQSVLHCIDKSSSSTQSGCSLSLG